ncbi:hypothetical protein C8Q70DRAFT_995627 [Cubamyces menziesii]|nr:hypothetical protein C8Q70DRAFT_995627 [Cubamyces menziesii]
MPEYEPKGYWALGPTCITCGIHADTSPLGVVDIDRVHNQTWHDATYHNGSPIINITVKFTGRALYVYNLIANTVPDVSTPTVLDFILDGVHADTYTHLPDGSMDVLYDVPVYVNSSLKHGPHTLVIAATSYSNVSLILFDYMVYTMDDGLDASSLESSPLSLSAVGGFFSFPFSQTTAPRPGALTDSPSSLSSLISTSPPSPPLPSSSSESVAPTDTSTSSQAAASPSPSHVGLGVIVGCIVGSVVAAVLLTVLFRRCRKRTASTQLSNREHTRTTSRSSNEAPPGHGEHLRESCSTPSPPQAVRPATARPSSEHLDREPPARRRFRDIFWQSNAEATFHAEMVALRNEVAMLRSDGLGVQRRLDTPPPRYEPPRSRRVLKLWA